MSFWQRLRVPGLALLALLHVTGVCAQPVPLLGYVAAKNANPERLEVFRRGLAELGYVEGKTLRVEYREAVLDADYHAVIAEFIDRKADILIAANAGGAQ